ncbi:MFS transporter [Sphingobium sp. BS19]|uniref:MFS transporter n=1 Tax=Sphingobium sp. BS19 TaxID=3018973 RepID=UPI0022EE1667|nr:MFS transporter [Sphingobium sp. BS19]GLI96188.1 MFS transporter [Sphingobium sp. BS19]
MADAVRPAHQGGDYVFKPHERPFLAGSPATPDHPARRKLGYLLIGIYLAILGGFQNGLLLANLPGLQGHLALTSVEAGWVTVAYNMTNACMSILLFKLRQQFGIQRFVRIAMATLLLANFVQLFDAGYRIELVSRGISGIAASGLSTLGIYYLMQGLPAKARIAGVLIGLGLSQIALPLARAISPALIAGGDITHLFDLQFALSLMAFGMVFILPLPPGEIEKAFEKLDLVTFPLLAIGMGLLCAFLVQGRIQWWTTPWLGWALAGAILLIGAAFLIEHNRANPMLHTRWMTSKDIVIFASTGALMRVLLSEQGFGAGGLLTTVGMINDQLVTYYWIITGATFIGLVVLIARLDTSDLQRPLLVALALIAVAAFVDTQAGLLSRPENFYWTQAMMAFAAIYFIGSAMMEGLLRALAQGMQYIISFIAVFSLSQTLGGLAGVAGLAAFQTIWAKVHLMDIGRELTLSDPAVAQAIQLRAAAYNGTIADPVLRQASGAGQLVQQAGRDAAILAFNDMFFLIGIIASLAFAAILAKWIYNRRRGINPLAKELEALASIMGGAKE